MKKKAKLIRRVFWIFISVFGTGLFLWFILLGKIRATQILAPFLSNVPKNQEELKEAGKNVLGTAESAATSQNAQQILEKGADFFETSKLTEPIRQLRESITQKLVETIETIREIPAREVRTVKREVCKQWLEEDAVTSTSAASP